MGCELEHVSVGGETVSLIPDHKPVGFLDTLIEDWPKVERFTNDEPRPLLRLSITVHAGHLFDPLRYVTEIGFSRVVEKCLTFPAGADYKTTDIVGVLRYADWFSQRPHKTIDASKVMNDIQSIDIRDFKSKGIHLSPCVCRDERFHLISWKRKWNVDLVRVALAGAHPSNLFLDGSLEPLIEPFMD
jgi:hypothetical protein